MGQIVYPVTFNGVDLNTITGLTVLSTDLYKPPKRDLSISDIVRTNKSKINSAFYVEKKPVVRVGIARATRALVEQSLDALNCILQEIEKSLIVPQSGSSRRYVATLDDTNILVAGGSYIELELIFKLSDRFGYDLAPTLILDMTTPYTSSNRSDGLTFGGSSLWQQPVITITYTAVGGGTGKVVTIGNSQTGQQVAITKDWVAGDVIVVDSSIPSVKVNGAEVGFVGAIPEWKRGSGFWYYSDTFTSRTFSGSITHVRRYV